jgi:hypothetical protein
MKKFMRKQIGLWMLSIAMLFTYAATASATAQDIESYNNLATANTYNYGEGAAGFVNSSDPVEHFVEIINLLNRAWVGSPINKAYFLTLTGHFS